MTIIINISEILLWRINVTQCEVTWLSLFNFIVFLFFMSKSDYEELFCDSYSCSYKSSIATHYPSQICDSYSLYFINLQQLIIVSYNLWQLLKVPHKFATATHCPSQICDTYSLSSTDLWMLQYIQFFDTSFRPHVYALRFFIETLEFALCNINCIKQNFTIIEICWDLSKTIWQKKEQK